MGQTGVQTVATFTGTLLQRRRAEGKPFTQLIFREAGKDWLCLSSNLAHVAKLQIGKKYKIEGIFKSLGDHAYIHEPEITLAKSKFQTFRRWSAYTVVVLVVAAATAFAVKVVHGNLSPTSAETNKAQKQASSGVATTESSTDQPQPAAAPVADTVTPPPTTATTTKKKTTPHPTPPAPVVTPPVSTQPDCDAPFVSTPYGHVAEYHPDMDEGTLIQQGVDEQSQTCYPNGRNQPGQTTVTAPGKDEVRSTQTPPATT